MWLPNAKPLQISLFFHSITILIEKGTYSLPLNRQLNQWQQQTTDTRYSMIWNGPKKYSINESSSSSTYDAKSYAILLPQSITSRDNYSSVSRINDQFSDFLQKNSVHVRLNIVYDSTMTEQYSEEKLEIFIRNLIFATQLIYEQPEMFHLVKMNLVVINISKTKSFYPHNLSHKEILDYFAKSQDLSNIADVNVLFVFRNIWQYFDQTFGKAHGIAYLGSFCNENRTNDAPPPVAMINAASVNAAIVLAHELGHSLNANHDGHAGTTIEIDCPSNKFIMGPYSGSFLWSTCTSKVIFQYLLSKIYCVFSKTRLATIKPFKPMFDFRYEENRLLPGRSHPIDQQCNDAIGPPAMSSLKKLGSNGPHSTCHNLSCTIDGTQVSIGPAVMGSECQLSDDNIGICMNSFCAPQNKTNGLYYEQPLMKQKLY